MHACRTAVCLRTSPCTCCPWPLQRDADAAAERAAHWCSLADLLQRSALLPDGPASPEGSGAGSLSATLASTAAKSLRAPSSPQPISLGRMRGADAASSAARLLAEWRSPVPASHNCAGAGSGSGSPQGPGRLLKAFQAVAGEHVPPSPKAPSSAAVTDAETAAPSAQPPPSAKRGPRISKLVVQQPGPSPASTGSAGHGPLTPLPYVMAPGAGELAAAASCSGARSVHCCGVRGCRIHACPMSAPAAAVATPGTGSTWSGTPAAAPASRKLPERRGLFGRLLSITACGGGLAAQRIQ